jgi:uncharacterized membrane protein YfcA
MEILGYIGAVLMGLSLGLIGGGGSILTVPILVYLFSVDAVLATAYSLFIVGITALFGSFSHMRMGNIHWNTVLYFGVPSIVAVFATRTWLVPALPDPLFWIGTTPVHKSFGLLILFALLMVAAAYSMIRRTKAVTASAPSPSDELRTSDVADLLVSAVVTGVGGGDGALIRGSLVMLEGVVVGTITGLVGAGGGFLIIPALVLLAKLPMKQAVGTSLLIIAAKSLIGFIGDLRGNAVMDWNFLLLFSLIAIGGIIAGSLLSKRVSNEKLKPAFGWFVLVMGLYIITRELSGMA